MITFPSHGTATEYAFRYQQSASAELDATTQNKHGSAAISVSASYSSSVTITGSSSSNLAFAPAGVEKYQAVADAPPKSVAANNILSFISQRLALDAADGASQEEIESRLQAGYEGFLQGYGEAFDELAGAGLLSPEVEEAIAGTKEAVLAGIQELAEQYGVESPVENGAGGNSGSSGAEGVSDEGQSFQTITSQTPAFSSDPASTFAKFAGQIVRPGEEFAQLLESSTIDYEQLAARDFSFKLKTQDGDTVVIKASAARGDKVSASAVNYQGDYENYRAGRYESESFESSRFHLSVEGELDEDELAAINDLLGQVGDLSETFFAGDVEGAFTQALEIGFDESEIAKFSLNLRQEVVTKVETTYARIQDVYSPPQAQGSLLDDERDGAPSVKDNSVSRLMGFVEMLKDLAKQADELGVGRKELPAIANKLASSQHNAHDAGDKLERFMDRMLENIA